MTTFQQFQLIHGPKVEKEMISFLKENCSEKSLFEAMVYSIQAGGKRIRPLLLLATIEALGGTITQGHYQVAAALEMVHTYSLIHDDLPAMDNDDLRRGKPTNHKVYGEALAILAGDGLLTEAFDLLGQSEILADKKVQLLTLFAQAAGSKGMIGGQVADIGGETRALSLEELQAVHTRKTGALIEYAVVAGTILTNGTEQQKSHLKKFAYNFGLAFQIKDDLLDVIGDEKEIGKKTGMDQSLNKSTYPSLLGVVGAEKALQEKCLAAEKQLMVIRSENQRESSFALFTELLTNLRKV